MNSISVIISIIALVVVASGLIDRRSQRSAWNRIAAERRQLYLERADLEAEAGPDRRSSCSSQFGSGTTRKTRLGAGSDWGDPRADAIAADTDLAAAGAELRAAG